MVTVYFISRCFSASLSLVLSFLVFSSAEYYSEDGTGNNLVHDEWGSSSTTMRRLNGEVDAVSYADGVEQMDTSLPNPRIVSNMLGQLGTISSINDNYGQITLISMAFATLLSVDMCGNFMNQTAPNYEPITVPTCDWFWDPSCEGNKTMPFYRTNAQFADGVRSPLQSTSSYLDLSFLYSNTSSIRTYSLGQISTSSMDFDSTSELVTALFGGDDLVSVYSPSPLRTFVNDVAGTNVPAFDYNSGSNSISNLTQCPLFSYTSKSAGNSNNVPYSALSTLWALEHNRLASELHSNFSDWDDEKLFWEARQLNIALFQHVTYNEYVPVVLAKNYNNMDLKYNASLDASTSNVFCTLGMRYGHGTMPSLLPFGGHKSGSTWGTANFGEIASEIVASVPFRDTYEHPCLGLQEIGSQNYVASLVAGLMLGTEVQISPKYCEELRSFVYAAGVQTEDSDVQYWDMLAVDILRSRDHGIPSYNDLRELVGLSAISEFSELTTNKYYQRALKVLYDDVDDLDAMLGALIEDVEAATDATSSGSGFVGPVFASILNEQYLRSYAGDRLFYRWNDTLVSFVDGVYLSDIIERNLDLKNVSFDVFGIEQTANAISGSSLDEDGYNSVTLLDGAYTLRWKLVEDGSALEGSDSIVDYLDIFITVEIGSSDEGWIGLGYGDTEYMNDKDISKVVYTRDGEDTFQCMDTFSTDWKPEADTSWASGSEDLYECTATFEDDSVTVGFKKPLTTSDRWDFDIPVGETSFFIAAYNPKDTEDKHDTNKRTPGEIDWKGGTVTAITGSDRISTVRLYHGITMIALFLFAYPISGFVARYLRHYPFWRELHKMIGSLGVMSGVTSAYTAFSTVDSDSHFGQTHNVLGITCIVLLVSQVMGGYFVNYWLLNNARGNVYRYLHYGHLLSACVIIFMAPMTCYYGWQRLQPMQSDMLDSAVSWYMIVMFLVLLGEFWRRFYLQCSDNAALDVFRTNYHVYTWDQIGEKVSAGAAWLVIGKYIYDVTSWQGSHPGGRRILLDYIGTDCTEMFHGNMPVGDMHGGITHPHSDWAVKQMTQMVVGEIPFEETNEYLTRNQVTSTQTSPRESKDSSHPQKLNLFTDRVFHKYAALLENSPLVQLRAAREQKDKRAKQNIENAMQHLAAYNANGTNGTNGTNGSNASNASNSSKMSYMSNIPSSSNNESVQPKSSKSPNTPDSPENGSNSAHPFAPSSSHTPDPASDAEQSDEDFSRSSTYESLFKFLQEEKAQQQRDGGISHVKAEHDELSIGSPSLQAALRAARSISPKRLNLEAAPSASKGDAHAARRGADGADGADADHVEMARPLREHMNNHEQGVHGVQGVQSVQSVQSVQPLQVPSQASHTLQLNDYDTDVESRFAANAANAKLPRLLSSSSLNPIFETRAKANTLEALQLDQQRFKLAKRFRSIKLIYKCKLTPEQCPRPIMLLEWDVSKLQIDNRPGEYFLLHHIDKNSVSRAYTPVPAEFVLCDNGAHLESLQNLPINRKNKVVPENKIRTKDRYERTFLMVRLYQHGRMSKVLNKLKPGLELRLTGPFVRQKVLPRVGKDFGYGDRCWRHLVMIAGGTGFTPMLDALMHHLEYGSFAVKILLVWFNKKPYDICCMGQFEWLVKNYPERLCINLVFTQDTDEPVANEICSEWKKRVAQTIYYGKWSDNECVQVISKFLQEGKVGDVRRSDSIRVVVPPNSDEKGADGEESSKSPKKPFVLDRHDRVILSGPKLFVESFLTWIRDGDVFKGTNIGKQIICYD